jgi:hypothetical protein
LKVEMDDVEEEEEEEDPEGVEPAEFDMGEKEQEQDEVENSFSHAVMGLVSVVGSAFETIQGLPIISSLISMGSSLLNNFIPSKKEGVVLFDKVLLVSMHLKTRV